MDNFGENPINLKTKHCFFHHLEISKLFVVVTRKGQGEPGEHVVSNLRQQELEDRANRRVDCGPELIWPKEDGNDDHAGGEEEESKPSEEEGPLEIKISLLCKTCSIARKIPSSNEG